MKNLLNHFLESFLFVVVEVVTKDDGVGRHDNRLWKGFEGEFVVVDAPPAVVVTCIFCELL